MNDRAISYLYEWKKGGTIFRNITHEQFNQEFTEYLLLGCLEDIKHCLETYGELGCIYKTQGNDGIMIVSGIGIYYMSSRRRIIFFHPFLSLYCSSVNRVMSGPDYVNTSTFISMLIFVNTVLKCYKNPHA